MPYNQPAWRPTANLNNLRLRCKILSSIRQFFAEREVLEVDTPLLSHGASTDPHLSSFTSAYHNSGSANIEKILYLQTSPEFAMKRLLAAGSGAIYQICKAFRNGEHGRQHNPEFTMLEWYRPGFDHYQLMDEVDSLLQLILHTAPAQRLSYADVFQFYLHIDPHRSSIFELQTCAKKQGLTEVHGLDHSDRDAWLNVLITHFIEPYLGQEQPVFIYDFPASQAALAKIRDDEIPVAERFEVYMGGMELANGFHELTDAQEQHRRFIADNHKRKNLNLPEIPIDHHLLSALSNGLPNCAGVALGIDRLVMLALKVSSLAEIISFSLENA